jgi:hypothetical protein
MSYYLFLTFLCVVRQAAISQDQSVVENFVGFDSAVSFDTAAAVYEFGGNSKSWAELTLSAALPTSVKKGDSITGSNDGGTTIVGTAYDNYPQGSMAIGVQYLTGESYENHVTCRVGGLPEDLWVETGCKLKRTRA